MLRYAFFAILLLASASAANAQPSPPAQPTQQSVEELQAQYLFETGQLRQALGQAQAQNIQLRKENAELKMKADVKTEPKK